MGQEDRSILDRPLRELERLCHYVCENPRCPESKKFEGIKDNALVKCTLRYYREVRKDQRLEEKDISQELTEAHFAYWEEGVRADVQKNRTDFPQKWEDCSPRFVFHVNKALKEHEPEEEALKIRVCCAHKKCERVLGTLSLKHTLEKLYNDLRLYLVNDPTLPFQFVKGGENRSLPDDARAVCELVHRPAVDKFVEEDLPKNLRYIEASLDDSEGTLRVRLEEKQSRKRQEGQEPTTTYLRIGLGLAELGKFTAVLELWPNGHRSPKHAHGGCAGSVRVVHGALRGNIYNSIRDEEPLPGKKAIKMSKGMTTWLNRQNNFVHEVWCDPREGHPFAMSVHLYKSCDDEFAWVQDEHHPSGGYFKMIVKGNPSNDFFWNISLPEDDRRVQEVREGKVNVKDFATVLNEGKARDLLWSMPKFQPTGSWVCPRCRLFQRGGTRSRRGLA